MGVPHFSALAGDDPCEYPYPETRRIIQPDAENSTIVSSFVWTKHRNVTDGRTDGQTAPLQWPARRTMLTRCRRELAVYCNCGLGSRPLSVMRVFLTKCSRIVITALVLAANSM